MVLDLFDGSTGIGENALPELTVFPNPAQDRITVQNRTGTLMDEITVQSADGRVVRRTGRTATNAVNIEIVDMPAGVYTITCAHQDLRTTTRFIKH